MRACNFALQFSSRRQFIRLRQLRRDFQPRVLFLRHDNLAPDSDDNLTPDSAPDSDDNLTPDSAKSSKMGNHVTVCDECPLRIT